MTRDAPSKLGNCRENGQNRTIFVQKWSYQCVKQNENLYLIAQKYKVSLRTLIAINKLRPPYNLMVGQSLNLWVEDPNYKNLTQMHMYGWKKGLKTGMYYLRSKSAVDAVKITVSEEKLNKEKLLNKIKEEEECLTCSA